MSKTPFQQLMEVNTIYHYQTEEDKLISASELLCRLVDSGCYNQENRDNAVALIIRLRIKAFLCSYYHSNFDKDLPDRYAAFASAQQTTAQPFAKTRLLLDNATKLIGEVSKITDSVKDATVMVFDSSNRLATTDSALIDKSISIYNKLLADIDNSTIGRQLFDDKIQFVDIASKLKQNIETLIHHTNEAKQQLRYTLYQAQYDRAVVEVDRNKYSGCNYYPVVFSDNDSNTIRVICSPIAEEVELLMSGICKNSARNLVYCKLDILATQTADCQQYIIDKLSKLDCNILCLGYNSAVSKGNNCTDCVIQLSNLMPFNRIYVADPTAQRTAFETLHRTIVDQYDNHNITRLAYCYLTMPFFSNVIQILSELSMIDNDNIEFVKDNCKYMGFVGLNQAIIAHSTGADWQLVAQDYSLSNGQTAIKYIKALPTQSQLLDSGWGEVTPNRLSNDGKKSFVYDYDKPHSLNIDNIALIVDDNRLNTLQKSGLMVKYCLLCGNDVSQWKLLDNDTIEQRIQLATVMLSRLLDTEYEPEVAICEKLSNGNAAGQCCASGRRLEFKLTSMRSFDYAVEVICHETFHSFQYTCMHKGWRQWHLDEMAILQRRVEEWTANNMVYAELTSLDGDSYNAYRYQVFESDANIFAVTALDYANSCWHMLDLQ